VTPGAGRRAAPALASLSTLAILGPPASSALGQEEAYGPPPPTRAEFIAQADPICREGNRKSAPYFRKVSKNVRKDRLVAAGRNLIRGERIQLRTGRELAELEPPPADADRIERWLALVQRGVRRAITAGQWLTRGNLDRAARHFDEGQRLFRKGRRQVRSIDFEVCA
jgi:hypothetical protein